MDLPEATFSSQSIKDVARTIIQLLCSAPPTSVNSVVAEEDTIEPTKTRCPTCGSENLPEARFCGTCGVLLDAVVPHEAVRATTGNLVPMDLGDIINETFKVFGRGIWVFVIITVIAQIPNLVGLFIPNFALSVVFILVGIVANVLAEGAIIQGLSRQYLGIEPRVGDCYYASWKRVRPLFGGLIVLLIILAVCAALFWTIIGTVAFLYILVSRFFFPQAIMLEGKGPLEALSRSRELVKGSWWRTFGIGIVFIVILLILNFVAGIPGSIASAASGEAGGILLIIGQSLVMPLGFIGATLVYFNLRIRKEGYTLETMASEAGI